MRSSVRSRLAPPSFQALADTPLANLVTLCHTKIQTGSPGVASQFSRRGLAPENCCLYMKVRVNGSQTAGKNLPKRCRETPYWASVLRRSFRSHLGRFGCTILAQRGVFGMATSAEIANGQITAAVVRRVESPSYARRVVRPSAAEIIGIVIYVVISAAGIFGLVHYLI
jgi:hypothetical protein